MTTKIKFFSADNWRKYGWIIIGFITMSFLTSAGVRINTISENSKLGKDAYNKNIEQDSILCRHERQIQEYGKVSVVVMEKINGLEKKISDNNESVNKRLDDIYKILLSK